MSLVGKKQVSLTKLCSYTFKNIRFGATTAGANRWQKPQPPISNSTLQDGSYGPICPQGAPKGLNLLGPGDELPIGGAANQFLGGIPLPIFAGGDEVCVSPSARLSDILICLGLPLPRCLRSWKSHTGYIVKSAGDSLDLWQVIFEHNFPNQITNVQISLPDVDNAQFSFVGNRLVLAEVVPSRISWDFQMLTCSAVGGAYIFGAKDGFEPLVPFCRSSSPCKIS